MRHHHGGHDAPEATAMASSTALIAIVVMAVGGYVGWHMRQAYGLHSDIKTYKSRIPRFRAQRNRSGLISFVTIVVVLFLVYALLRLCTGAGLGACWSARVGHAAA
jgi:hypothetical protein